ncbi:MULTISPECIES: hypothetical protein [Sphingomonas]|jgi:hypothetical protein|uniref:Uncharacterized protein n=1 Tax=Sphingomonas yabuuchiae TaxID=172044 RepID=A0AA41A038_9SPHN|nr:MULTISPECIES: hypothetical protein [Sphingomonas]KQO50188.1 hypothetical protein ASF14_12275 [Sphingomonas sp. Leaf257]MBB4609833.1 hypothetical protein [Sphingomonas yabuuchiae]MBN3558324.1 hypothetical protein [Sphingomonas yabuuchiae]
MNLVEKAEQRSRLRAALFYALATILPLMTILALAGPGESTTRLLLWLLIIGLAALNLSSLPFRWSRCGPVSRLMNDETTKDHRRSSFAAGFWAMILSAATTMVVATFQPLGAAALGRITITAGLTAALIAFATLELRASR